MPRNATVYRIMIASPSDVAAERMAAREVILDWDAAHSIDTSIVLEPILWETHSTPRLGERPQDIINRQLVDSADMLIAIFWTRLGSPTGVAPSGTIEEIEQFIASGRPVLLYFSLQSLPREVDVDQLLLLRKFEASCRTRGLYSTYRDLHHFRESLAHHLAREVHLFDDARPAGPRKDGPSGWSYADDSRRLRIQADNLVRLDESGIKQALSFLSAHGNANPHILDVGCSDGYVTRSRFGTLKGVTVHGIDVDKDCIDIANRDHLQAGFRYTVADVESEADPIEPADLIFCGETLHHLKNPEGALHRLWGSLRSPGALVVRCSDDGFKFTHPDDEDLNWLLRSTHELRGSSDRQYGRKIYAQMRGLSPRPADIEMFFQVDSTVKKSGEERGRFFDDNHAFRTIYADKYNQAFGERTRKVFEAQRKRFVERDDLFALNIQNIAVACKLTPGPP